MSLVRMKKSNGLIVFRKRSKKNEYRNFNRIFRCLQLEKTLESPLDCKIIKPDNPKGNQSWIFIGRDGCWSWNSNTLATWCKELNPWKRPWCWEWLKVGGEGDDRAWDGWIASWNWWTWVWASSRSWWRTGKPCMLQSMGSQRVGHNWATEGSIFYGRAPCQSLFPKITLLKFYLDQMT